MLRQPETVGTSEDASASLLAMLDRLYLTCLAEEERLSAQRRREAIEHGLRRLRDVLEQRLGADSYLAEVVSEHPELDRRVRRLRDELAQLLGRLDNQSASLVGGASLDAVTPEVIGLVIAIRAHELDAQALIADAVMVDLGGSE